MIFVYRLTACDLVFTWYDTQKYKVWRRLPITFNDGSPSHYAGTRTATIRSILRSILWRFECVDDLRTFFISSNAMYVYDCRSLLWITRCKNLATNAFQHPAEYINFLSEKIISKISTDYSLLRNNLLDIDQNYNFIIIQTFEQFL